MAQASAQREPSMEEILASIRRIIEDSDNIRRPADLPRADPEPAAPARAEVETFQAELGHGGGAERRPALAPVEPPVAAVREPAPAQPNGAAPKAFRLAEVQAQVVRDAAAQPKAPDAGAKPVTLADVQRELAREPVAAPVRPAAASVAPQPQPARPDVRLAVNIQPASQPKLEKPAPQFIPKPAELQRLAEGQKTLEPQKPAEPVASGWRQGELAPKPNIVAPALEAVAKPIISEAASRQVAASFGQLSEAFAHRASKTFDEMAEQMLRPLLQDWLDNNLPVLVERLVREEIERVARGV